MALIAADGTMLLYVATADPACDGGASEIPANSPDLVLDPSQWSVTEIEAGAVGCGHEAVPMGDGRILVLNGDHRLDGTLSIVAPAGVGE